MRGHRSVFLRPILLVTLLDAIFTVIGQPSEYWQEFRNASEGSPLGFHFLQLHPWLFLFFMGIYMGGIILFLKRLPLFWSSVLGLTLFIGHAYGSSSWIYTIYLKLGFPDLLFTQWYLIIGYFLLISLLTIFLVKGQAKSSLTDKDE